MSEYIHKMRQMLGMSSQDWVRPVHSSRNANIVVGLLPNRCIRIYMPVLNGQVITRTPSFELLGRDFSSNKKLAPMDEPTKRLYDCLHATSSRIADVTIQPTEIKIGLEYEGGFSWLSDEQERQLLLATSQHLGWNEPFKPDYRQLTPEERGVDFIAAVSRQARRHNY